MTNKIKSFGETVRCIRESKGLLLRQVAAVLEVDTAFLSKMERNEKKASRIQVEKIANTLDVRKSDLLTIWLSDKLLATLKEERDAHNAIKLTEKRMNQK